MTAHHAGERDTSGGAYYRRYGITYEWGLRGWCGRAQAIGDAHLPMSGTFRLLVTATNSLGTLSADDQVVDCGAHRRSSICHWS
jgi:hypothetical protein